MPVPWEGDQWVPAVYEPRTGNLVAFATGPMERGTSGGGWTVEVLGDRLIIGRLGGPPSAARSLQLTPRTRFLPENAISLTTVRGEAAVAVVGRNSCGVEAFHPDLPDGGRCLGSKNATGAAWSPDGRLLAITEVNMPPGYTTSGPSAFVGACSFRLFSVAPLVELIRTADQRCNMLSLPDAVWSNDGRSLYLFYWGT